MTQHNKKHKPWEAEDEKDITSPEETLADELLDILKCWVRPAENAKEATLRLTMGEIIERLYSVYSGEIDPKDLFDKLRLAGFETYNQGGLDMVWLMVER